MRPAYRVGISHHLLFPAAMEDPALHEETLAEVLGWPEFSVVDLNCAGGTDRRAREARRVRESGKSCVYNTPLLAFLPGCDPNAAGGRAAVRTREAALVHLDAAAACGAALINISSGRNPPPEERERALRGWLDFFEWFSREAGARGLTAVIEPFDTSIGKNLLIGPTADAAASVAEVRRRGAAAAALMADMGHLPLMGESFAAALARSAPYLMHVHLGSAVMRDPAHPLYGDMHPPLGIPGGEHGAGELADFLRELEAAGYFARPGAALTFETRPYPGSSERESARRSLGMLAQAWTAVERGTA